jgi:hypothetical protein
VTIERAVGVVAGTVWTVSALTLAVYAGTWHWWAAFVVLLAVATPPGFYALVKEVQRRELATAGRALAMRQEQTAFYGDNGGGGAFDVPPLG